MTSPTQNSVMAMAPSGYAFIPELSVVYALAELAVDNRQGELPLSA
jgi:hypothetical protein